MKTSEQIKDTCDKLSDVITRIQRLGEFLPEEFPEGAKLDIGKSYQSMDIPYNLPLLNEVLAILEPFGWKEISREFVQSGGYLVVWVGNDTANVGCFGIYLFPSLKGSTCKLNVVGYEQRPIYETTCLQAG